MTDVSQKHPTEGLRWLGDMGERWNTYHEQFESMIGPAGAALIEAASFQPGETVLDAGCGAGGTTLEIAQRILPRGHVTGIDISPLLVGTAEQRARAGGFANASFIAEDATTAAASPRFDCVFSRFGVMFFDDPYGAFTNLRKFLKPGGRLVFACWGPMPENPWAAEAMGVVLRHKELPKPVPRAPGPFAFAETDYVRDILGKAGFRDISIAAWRGEQLVGGAGADARAAAQFLMDAAFVGDALKDDSRALKERVLADLIALFSKHDGPKGVRMPAMTWIVSAKN